MVVRRSPWVLLVFVLGCARDDGDWNEDLTSSDPFARLLAIVALDEIRPPDDGRLMMELLSASVDPDGQVRRTAAAALSRRLPHNLPLLVELAAAPSRGPRIPGLPEPPGELAAACLRRSESAPAIPLLRDALLGSGDIDRGRLARTLAALAPPAMRALLEVLDAAGPGERAAILAGLAELPAEDRSTAEVLWTVASERPALRPAVLARLVEALVCRLASAAPAERLEPSRRLWEIRRESVPGLLAVLRGRQGEVRDWAALSLLGIYEEAPELAANTLDLEEPLHADLLRRMAVGLGPEAVPVLLDLLASTAPGARRAAVDALQALGSAARVALPALREMAAGDDRTLARAARSAIAAIE